MTTSEFVINDYRDDWINRCIDIPNADYTHFEGLKIYWAKSRQETEMSEAMRHIFDAIKEKYAPHLKILPYDENVKPEHKSIILAWDLKERPLSDSVRENISSAATPVVYVADDDDFVPESVCAIYCGRIFGAGLTSVYTDKPSEDDCTNIIDFFASQLFMLTKLHEIPIGAYYPGYGKCPLINVRKLVYSGFANVLTYEDSAYMYDHSVKYPNDLFYFDNTYDGNLELLHDLLFKLLCEFDRICQKHEIKYFLGGGTLLGAVRHKGFIPWDDDVDVMMLRPDYEKFLSVVEDELDESMFFQSNQTDPQYHSVFTKIRLNGTSFVTSFSYQFHEMHQGIFIDIFVHDKTANNPKLQKLHIFKTLLARSMVFHKWDESPMHFYGKHKFICRLATKYIKRHGFDILENHQEKVIQKYKNKKTRYLYDGTGEHLRNGAFLANWLNKAEYVDFNGKKFPVPTDAKHYLKYSYGDYEQWVTASKRKASHDIVKVDFGKYKKEV